MRYQFDIITICLAVVFYILFVVATCKFLGSNNDWEKPE